MVWGTSDDACTSGLEDACSSGEKFEKRVSSLIPLFPDSRVSLESFEHGVANHLGIGLSFGPAHDLSDEKA